MTDDLTPLRGSGHLKAMGYDKETRILKVRFPGGATYQYRDVPPEVYEKLLAANKGIQNRSLGQEFHALVIKGGFKYEKI
jgi:hypothetical protein